MIFRPVRRRFVSTGLQFAAAFNLILAASGCTDKVNDSATGVREALNPIASGDGQPSSSTDAELTQQIQKFCGACHAVPMPDSFPKQAWFDEVKRGFEFYYESGRKDLVPPRQTAVVAWYQERAPEVFAEPDQSEVLSSSLKFEMRPINIPLNPDEAVAVSALRLTDSTRSRSQFTVSDMQRGVVIRCDLSSLRNSELLSIGSNPARTCDVDLDQDGHDDLVVADLGSFLPEDHNRGQVLWLKGDDSNSSPPRVIMNSIGRVSDVRPVDLDNDGDQDLVVAEFGWHKTGGIHVVFNDAGPTGERSFRNVRVDSRPGTIHVPVTDLDGDGRLDFIALISQEHEVIEAFLNRKTGFEKKRIYAAPDPSYGSSGIELTDMDNDGDEDILYTVGDTFDSYLIKPYHGIWWLRNDGQLHFEPQHIASMPGVHRAISADLDGDADQDIVASALLPTKSIRGKSPGDLQSLIWLEQTATGVFSRHVIQRGQPIYASIALSDINGDTDLDIVAGCFHTESDVPQPLLHVFENLRLSGPLIGPR